MTLSHNQHRGVYHSVTQWLEYADQTYDWKDDESKRIAIATDEVWTLQWYPDTPVGFLSVAAPTLEELLEFANSVSSEA